MNITNDNFTWKECWVITSVLWTRGKEIDINISNLSDMIGIGDAINRAIFYLSDMKQALVKAQKKGLISIYDHKIQVSEIGEEIQTLVKKKIKGGILELVGIVQTTLNSKKLDLKNVSDEEIDPCDFINEETFQEAYKTYHSWVESQNQDGISD
ncbi:MAG: hypothetical protein ACTSRE_16115 [Promethearchaeota archaeon]